MEKHGIKETKEALHGIMVLSTFVAAQAKDGLKLNDATALLQKFISDDAFKASLESAVKGIETVPDELGDLDAKEIVELIQFILPDVMNIIEALK